MAFVVAALAGLTYAGTLGYGFVWDDPISVGSWLPALPRIQDAFFPPPGIPQFPSDYYRPLQLLAYQLARAIGGGAPWPFHLSVVLLHMLATALVLRVGLRFLGPGPSGWWAATWAAVLFAVHPIHSESVAWMAACPDVMVTAAGLGALLAYWRVDWSEWQRSGSAAALAFVGLLAKENAAALLVLVPMSTILLADRGATRERKRAAPSLPGRSSPITLSPFAAAAAVYLFLRLAGSNGAMSETTVPSNPLISSIVTFGTYLRLLILPFPQNAYIADVPSGLGAAAVGAALTAGFAGLLWRAWRRDDRPLSFALLWLAIALGPSLAVLAKPATAPLAERYLYLPSAGFCWVFGLTVARAAGRGGAARIGAQITAASLIVAACGLTVSRNRVWADNYSLWSDTAAKNEVDALPLRSLAAATHHRGDATTAERLFKQALELRNTPRGKYIIYNNLGTIALERNDDAAAESYYRRAAEFDPAPMLLYNLALIELRRGLGSTDAGARSAKLAEARALFERAVAASPHDADIHVGLAQTAAALGDQTTARRHFAFALDLGLPASTDAAVRQRLHDLE